MLVTIVTLLNAQSCSEKKQICITPKISGDNVAIEVKFKSLDKQFIAFGFGANKIAMPGNEILAFTKNKTYVVNSYKATEFDKPPAIEDKWAISNIKESGGEVTCTVTRAIKGSGSANDFPTTDQTFIWATGKSSSGELNKHGEGDNGGFKVAMSAKRSNTSSTNSTMTAPKKGSSNTLMASLMFLNLVNCAV